MKDGKVSTAEGFLSEIRALGSDHTRHVVILQPRSRRTVVEAARSFHARAPEHLRLAQLDTLLLAARANVVGLNANLYVIGEDS
jgi:hypothetical protein